MRARAVIAAFAVAIASTASAEQKQRASFVLPPGQSRYTQQHVIEAGDEPGHKLRVYEVQRKVGAEGPTIEGSRLVELVIRGISDMVDTNGITTAYSEYLFENGDKLFARSEIVAVTDAGKVATLAAGRITGGTGKFRNVRGVIRVASANDPASGLLKSQFDIDYWFEK